MLLISLIEPICILSKEGNFKKGRIIYARKVNLVSYSTRTMEAEVIDLFDVLPEHSLEDYTDDEGLVIKLNLDCIISTQTI